MLKLEKLSTIHERVLRQKSKVVWINHRDSNSKFFHAQLKARQARNSIVSIWNDQGVQLIEPTQVQKEFTNFFQRLLGTTAHEVSCLNTYYAKDGPCLNREKQQALIQLVPKMEVLQALRDLPNDKSPGIDGFTAEFFKEFWGMIGEKVTQAILQFFDNEKLLKEINCNTITLVPKVSNPTYVREYRYIACCTTMYKIIAKILTVRLKIVADSLVGPSQSAFIAGRSILDNVIMAHELVKGYTQKGLLPRCLIKIDIRKTYDSVEWGILKSVLLEFGLPRKFVNWIIECITTVSYSLLINGGLTPKFVAKKGLR